MAIEIVDLPIKNGGSFQFEMIFQAIQAGYLPWSTPQLTWQPCKLRSKFHPLILRQIEDHQIPRRWTWMALPRGASLVTRR